MKPCVTCRGSGAVTAQVRLKPVTKTCPTCKGVKILGEARGAKLIEIMKKNHVVNAKRFIQNFCGIKKEQPSDLTEQEAKIVYKKITKNLPGLYRWCFRGKHE